MEFLIYLDVCCLNRPFDDQKQERIRLEAEAIQLILKRCQSLRSKSKVKSQKSKVRTAKIGFKEYDALHIACAEAGCADVLLTTDDRMLRLAARHGKLLQVRVENPLQWLIEVTDDGRD